MSLDVPIEGTNQRRRVLSGIGANTASMVLGPKYGATIALLDMAKVALPTYLFRLVLPRQPHYMAAAVAGLVGHNWPLYYRLKGGRGFAAILGGLLVIDWLGALVVPIVTLLLVMILTGQATIAYVAWVWVLVPYLWLRTHDPFHLSYALIINLLFVIATLPEMRLYLQCKRQGTYDAYMRGMAAESARWRGMLAMADRLYLFGKRRRPPIDPVA